MGVVRENFKVKHWSCMSEFPYDRMDLFGKILKYPSSGSHESSAMTLR